MDAKLAGPATRSTTNPQLSSNAPVSALTPQMGLAQGMPTAADAGNAPSACPAMLSGYERKMMRRLELAQRKAEYAAAGVPLPGLREKEQATTGEAKANQHDSDSDRLTRLAWEARQKGDMFYCFPNSAEQLRADAATLDRFVKSEELEDESLLEQRRGRPDQGLAEFLDRLETMQLQRRQQQQQQQQEHHEEQPEQEQKEEKD